MDVTNIKVIAMDLDGTLTQHKQPMTEEVRARLDALAERYRLVMVGAGQVMRIFNQMEHYPIDIIGNYGLQYGKYNPLTGEMEILRDLVFPCDQVDVDRRVTFLREKYGLTGYRGENVEYHPSGCITFPCLGTKALQADKLAYDPDRCKRRAIYQDVCAVFSDYVVFVGGSSSFDLAPKPYDKRYALELFCKENGFNTENVLYIGDDYGPGGNDESVYLSDFAFLCIDDFREFPAKTAFLLDGKKIGL
ncbi:MAG: HAD family phosphatase [Oscillospiraceae bacterium]|nr:HAD family phosphatase [Oscillospiraceae bacterium]